MAVAGTPGLKGLVTCPLCFEEMENPKMLLCQHTYCTPCLTRLVKEDQSTGGKQQIIECPECRKQTLLDSRGIEGLGSSLIVNKIKSMWFNKSTICDVCRQSNEDGDTVAKWWCEQCDNNLCEPCKGKHDAKKIFKKHQVIDIEYIKCEIHRDKIIQFLCFGCQKFICSMCAMTECSEHEQEEISNQTSSILTTVAKEQIQALRGLIAKNKTNITEIQEAIDKHAEAKIELIRKSTKSLKENVANELEHFNSALDGYIAEKEKNMTETETLITSETDKIKLLTLSNKFFKSLTCAPESGLPTEMPICSFHEDDTNISLGGITTDKIGPKVDYVLKEAIKISLSISLSVGEVTTEVSGPKLDDALKESANVSISLSKKKDVSNPTVMPILGEKIWEVEGCHFCDVAYLPDERLVVVCFNDKKVLLYSNDGRKMEEYACDFNPNFIAYNPHKLEIIVTGANPYKTIVLKVADKLVKERDIRLVETSHCYGLHVLEDGNIASVHMKCSIINIQTMEGELVSRIETPGVKSLAINEHSGCFYIGKYIASGIQVYSRQGLLLHDITEGLGVCRDVAIDDQGYIWVTEVNDKRLAVINKKGEVIQRHDLDIYPLYISITKHMVCVTGYITGNIHKRILYVYKI